jgi:hypothetical protein
MTPEQIKNFELGDKEFLAKIALEKKQKELARQKYFSLNAKAFSVEEMGSVKQWEVIEPNKETELEVKAKPLDRLGNSVSAIDKSPQNFRKNLFKMRREIGKHVARVKPCGCYLNNTNSVTVCKGHETGKHYFSGLQTCKSVWSCPVCSLKITQERAKQIRDIAKNAQDEGLNLVFATFTIPHTAFQKCRQLNRAVTNGFRKMLATRRYQYLKRLFNIVGYVKSLEITHGKNGWHPHLHVLFFFEGIDSHEAALEGANEIFLEWQKVIKRLGFGNCSKDAFEAKNVFDGEELSEYISKWDLSKEMSEGHTKKTSITPFVLFKKYMETGCEDSLRLFLEFSEAFHGARQLTFSKGLKDRFLSIEDKTDEEICEDETGEIKLSMSADVWKNGVYGLENEANILNLLDSKGLEAVHEVMINSIGCSFVNRSGINYYYFDST